MVPAQTQIANEKKEVLIVTSIHLTVINITTEATNGFKDIMSKDLGLTYSSLHASKKRTAKSVNSDKAVVIAPPTAPKWDIK